MSERVFVVRNEDNRICGNCKRVHVYLTRSCTVIAFGLDDAKRMDDFGQWHLPPDGVKTVPFKMKIVDPYAPDQVVA